MGSISGKKYNILKYAIIAALSVLVVVFSVFCLKRFLKNSNVIEYDLSSFLIKEGFDGEITESGLTITPVDGYDIRDLCAESSYTLLDKGNYSVGLAYESSDYNVAYIQAGDSVYEEILLPAGDQTVFHNFTLDQSVEDARLRICFTGEGHINIKTMILQGDEPLVADWVVILGLVWGLLFVGFLYTKAFMTKSLTKGHLYEIGFVLLIAFSSVPFLILMNKGIYWGADTTAHNMRIEGLKDALLNGEFPVVVAPSMCNGYGSISPVMYPSLFLYPLAFLRILGVSPVLVYKIGHMAINLFMCSTCYVCVKKITRNSFASGIALITFAFSRFHLSMLGTRDWTYGMGIALIFLFIVIIGVYEVFFGKKEEWPYLTIGMWGIMNSHIMTTLFAAFIVGVFVLVFQKKLLREDRLKSLIKAVAASVPVCLYRIYTFLDAFINNELNTSVLNLNEYQERVYSIGRVFQEPLVLLPFAVCVISAIYFVIRHKRLSENNKIIFGIFWGIDILCVVLMLDAIPWNTIISMRLFYQMFGYIQFPNRLLQMSIPLSVILIGIISTDLFELINGNDSAFSRVKIRSMISIGVLMIGVISVWSYKEEITTLTSMRNVFSDKIIGDVYSFPGMDDYVPEGENSDSYSGRLPYYSNDSVSIDPETYKKNGINISGAVECNENDSYIDFPVFGYKGYECTDSEGNKYKTGVGEHHRLRVFFNKTSGPIFINIKYHVPGIYFALQVLSYVSLLALIIFNRDFLARTKKRVGYYEFIGLITGRT